MPQFAPRARFAGIVAGHGEAAAEFASGFFKSTHIVAVPAVQRDGDLRQRGDGGFGIDAEFGITFLRQSAGAFDG